MKWFQQNRWLGTFLIVAGVCLLLAGGILYWARARWNDARQAFDRATAERSRLERLDPFPNDANYRKLKVHLENYSAALEKLKEGLKQEVVPLPSGLAPNVFQSRLRQATVATLNRARANGVKLPDKFQLGFDEFTTTMPKTPVAPLLGQELSQIQMLINILLDAKVDSVTAFHRTPLEEERGVAPTPTPKPTPVPRKGSAARGAKTPKSVEPGAAASAANLVERNVVDLTFKAAPAAARKVLNEIVSSTGQFYIIRTLYVRNEKDKGPSREKRTEATPPPVEPAAPGQQGSAGPLNFIVGNEHIEVSATIEMLRFTF